MNALSPIAVVDAIEWQPAARKKHHWPAVLSLGVHGGLLAAVFVLIQPQPESADLAGSSVQVEIIATQTVSSNTAEFQSDASVDMVSAGGAAVAPTPPSETLEAVEPVAAETVRETAEMQPVEALAPVETAAVQEPLEEVAAVPLLAMTAAVQPDEIAAIEAKPAEAVERVEAASLQPVEDPAEDVPPVPQPRTAKQQPAESKPAAKQPAPKKQDISKQKPVPSKPQAGGNGGNSDADAKASAQAGGQKPATQPGNGAAVTKYPGQVLAKLRRALRYPAGGRGGGEVSVQFTVSSGGQPSGIRVVKSSGSPVFDSAAVETVRRASPFPPIPPEVAKASWTFTMPLGFVR